MMIPAEAPNASTRALEAASDFSNSPRSPLILPNGAPPKLTSTGTLLSLLSSFLSGEVSPCTCTVTEPGIYPFS